MAQRSGTCVPSNIFYFTVSVSRVYAYIPCGVNYHTRERHSVVRHNMISIENTQEWEVCVRMISLVIGRTNALLHQHHRVDTILILEHMLYGFACRIKFQIQIQTWINS
jgi:hypothetical protein